MSSDYAEELKELSGDEESYRRLKELFDEEKQRRRRAEKCLELLEGAIRDDYDAIMITEMELEEPGPRIVYVNDVFCKMTGYSREEVIGETPRILQGPKTDREVLDRLKERLKQGKPFFGQTVNYRKDGSEFVNQWDIHPLTDREGNVTHWVSYQHDISERKEYEQVVIDTKAEFDSLREASRSTVVDMDAKGNIIMANRAFRELTGYTKDELRSSSVWDLFPARYRDSLKSRFERGEEEEFHEREFKGLINRKSGTPVQIEGSTRLMKLKDRTLIRATIRNISFRKRVMDALDSRSGERMRSQAAGDS